MRKINRIVLSGGGTGGHIYPALSVYKRLKAENPDLQALYIGTEKGLEATLIPKEGIEFKAIKIQGLKRSLSLDNVKTGYELLMSMRRAQKMIEAFKPDVVLGTGGYVCAPVLLAAAFLSYPTMIHEQNSVAGITNKLLARFVSKIGICFDDVRSDFKNYEDKIVLTGNPRGQEVVNTPNLPNILQNQFNLDNNLPTVLVFGGSRGAPAINQAAINEISAFNHENYQVIIATGSEHYDQLVAEINHKMIEAPSNVRVVPYIENMPEVFKAIDLVVCRSGATTLTELMALGLPSILIPSPYVTNNHQEMNAKALVSKQAALMILEKNLNKDVLKVYIDGLMKGKKNLSLMSNHAKELGIIDATDRIVRELEAIAD